MSYEIKPLKPEVYLIQWTAIPSQQQAGEWVRDVQAVLDAAPHPVFFVSDLQRGYVEDVHALRRVGELTAHPMWGGGVSYSGKLGAQVFVRAFDRLSASPKGDRAFTTIGELTAALDRLKPGVADGIDWPAVLNPQQ